MIFPRPVATLVVAQLCGMAILASINPFFVTTIPKSGTHLLVRCLQLITGADRKQYAPKKKYENSLDYRMREYLPTIPQLKQWAPPSHTGYVHLHLAYNPLYENYFAAYQRPILLMIRDPRDLLVSRVHYLKAGKRKDFPYKNLPFNELLTSFIGTEADTFIGMRSWIDGLLTSPERMCNIHHLYDSFLDWQQYPHCKVVRFEDLVGSKGGGNDILQAQTVQKIATHIGIPISDMKAKQIGHKLFGNGSTFRRGMIGSWKEHFTQGHKQQFKNVAAELLMRLGYEQNEDW